GAATGRRRGAATQGPRFIGMNLILAVLVAGLVVAGWFIANQHQLLVDGQQELASAEDRLVVLEDRLRVTDEAMTESGQDTQQKIGFWESEIRKLWAVTNERNRKWIKDNEANLAKSSKVLEALQVSNRDISSAVGRHETAFSQQSAIIDQLASVDLQLQQILSAQRDLVDKVNAAQQSVAGLQSGLSNRVKDNEQAVAAIDAYRLQLNTRLATIERRLNNLADAQVSDF
ncbi:MAG: hypothetical protein OES38_23265, partial [Gammaproteobacteria bacterium]|nr:hypothetical protein [Gammaproteobacteria bacterium]